MAKSGKFKGEFYFTIQNILEGNKYFILKDTEKKRSCGALKLIQMRFLHNYRWMDYMRTEMQFIPSICIDFGNKSQKKQMFHVQEMLNNKIHHADDYSRLVESCYCVFKQYRSEDDVIKVCLKKG